MRPIWGLIITSWSPRFKQFQHKMWQSLFFKNGCSHMFHPMGFSRILPLLHLLTSNPVDHCVTTFVSLHPKSQHGFHLTLSLFHPWNSDFILGGNLDHVKKNQSPWHQPVAECPAPTCQPCEGTILETASGLQSNYPNNMALSRDQTSLLRSLLMQTYEQN